MKKTVKLFVSILLSLVLLSSTAVFAENQSIVEIAAGNEDFSILVAALQKADLVGALESEGPFTVFAPTNEAFKKLFNELKILPLDLINHPQLAEVLLYHVVPGKVLSTDLQDGMEAETLSGEKLTVDLKDGVKINGSTVTAADIEATNGVIHVIDTVLIPETFQLTPVETFQVAEPAQEAVVEPEQNPEEEPAVLPATVVDIALDNADFGILVAALQKADLVRALQGEGPFTVFAPTDAAFRKLLNELKLLPLELLNHPQLADVLLYHVVPGKVLSTDLVNGMEAETLNGEKITVDLTDGVKINKSSVIAADLLAGNGVVHVIDTVLVPESFQLVPTAAQVAEPTQEPAPQLPSIVEIAVSNPDFSTLAAAVQKAGLVEAISGEGPFTVFAPTNEAFEKLLDELGITKLDLINHPQLKDVLLYHVVAGKVLSTDLQDGMEIDTLGGQKLTVDLKDGVKINGSAVTAADIEASNGVVHVIDTVLIPETFQLVPAETAQEVEPAPETAQQPAEEPAAQLGTIADIAVSNPDFTILVGALQKAGLVEALQGEGPFTVFAPTNAAFMKLLGQLKASPMDLVNNPQLADVLLYHVVSGKILSTDLQNGMQAETLNGQKLTVDLTDGVKINGAKVIGADIEASNGVIHVIDSVLVPPTFQLSPEAPATSEGTTYRDLTIGSEGEDVLRLKQRFIELGYYRNVNVNSRFTEKTGETVMRFKKDAGLPADDGIADSQMQTVLYSDAAPRQH